MTGTDAVSSSPKSRLLSRGLFAALLIAGLIFLVIQLAPQTIGETARRHLQQQLQQHYPECRVSIRRGSFQRNIGLIFEGIRVAESDGSLSAKWHDAIHIEKLVVVADFHADKLAAREMPLVSQKIVIDGLHINADIDSAGQLSVARFWPLPKLGPAAPRVEVHNTDVRFTANQSKHPLTLLFSEILLVNDPASGEQSIAAGGSAPYLGAVQLQGKFDRSGLKFSGQVRDARLNDDLLSRLPIAWSNSIREASGFDGLVDAAFQVTRAENKRLEYQLEAKINNGRFDHLAMPQPISQISGLIVVDPDHIHIKTLQGKFGDAVVRTGGMIDTTSWPNNSAFTVSANGLLLNDNLADALPDSMRAGWDKLQPYGHIDIERSSVQCRDGRWIYSGTLYSKGVNVRYEKMPYPAEQLVGRVEIADGIATCYEMNGRVGGRHMTCAFRQPIQPNVSTEKVFRIRTDGPVAIDNTLVDALTPRGENQSKLETFVRSLHPQGAVHVVDALLQTDATGRQSRTFDLRIVNGHLRYDKFAYPLYNVTGQIYVTDDLVALQNFEANDSSAGQIKCNGWYRMPHPSQPKLDTRFVSDLVNLSPGNPQSSLPKMQLLFNASQIAMDGALRSSLSESARLAWDAISPSGILDQLDVIVTQQQPDSAVTTDIKTIQRDADVVTNRTLSLQPPALPYRLDVLGGIVRFDGRQVLIDSIRTQHDATRVSADGKCIRGQDGRWNLMLNIQGGSRLHPDAELIASLPEQMREAMHRLQLRGPLSVRGTTQIVLADADRPAPVVNWDLNMQLEGNRIGDVGPVHSVRGELKTTGTSDANGLRSVGEVQIDSMHINDLHVTSIRGPFLIEDDRLYLGNQEDSDQRTRIQSINGSVFGGDAAMQGEVVLSSGKFEIAAAIDRGQVPRLLAELGQGQSELSGTFNARTQLEGFLGTTELLKGNGSANVTDANMYQLPLLVQLLNLLRITPTEDVAFTDGNAIFQIVENQISFHQLQLWGDLVALDGSGTLNRRRELDLTFNTRVSPQNSFNRLIRPLTSSQYTLLTVDVRGPLNSPLIQRRTFDGVSETLEMLFPVINDGNQDRQQQAKRWWPPIFR